MTWKPADLHNATVDELLAFAMQSEPTLRQMHAIKELALRATRDPEFLAAAVDAIVGHLGYASVMGGLPVGYLGAKVLFDQGGEARQALAMHLATAPPLEREDLLRWLQPPPTPTHAITPLPWCERELIFHSQVTETQLEAAIRSILGLAASEVIVEVLPLAGTPASVAMVKLLAKHWDALERDSARLSALLGTTIYWFPPDELGSLGPDLRVAVHDDGRRDLVIARYTSDGFDIEPYREGTQAP